MNTKINETDRTQYRIVWYTSRPNPRYVRGGRAHSDIQTHYKSDVFDSIEEAEAFRATVTEQSTLQGRKPGKKNFLPIWNRKV